MVSPVMVALWRVVPPENNMYVPCDPVLRCPNKQQQGQLRGLNSYSLTTCNSFRSSKNDSENRFKLVHVRYKRK